MIIYLNLRENHVQNYLIQITYRINCLGKAYKIDLLHRFWSLHYDITRTHSFSRLFPFWTEWLFIFLILHARSIASTPKTSKSPSYDRRSIISLNWKGKGFEFRFWVYFLSEEHDCLQFLIGDWEQAVQLSWEKNYKIRKVCVPGFFIFSPKKFMIFF